MRLRLIFLLTCAPWILVAPAIADTPPQKPQLTPIYVTPYYDSRGPQIRVGEFSDELKSATSETILDLAKSMKKKWQVLPIEAMFVLSIRLYDMGHKDEATFWFHSARYRGILFRRIVPKAALGGIGEPGFERIQSINAFSQLAGEYINGYAFGDLTKLHEILGKVIEENEPLPDFNAIYPQQTFIPAAEWTEQSKLVAADRRELREQMTDPKYIEQVKAARQQNGIEGKY